ncbi:hypothetical protein ACFTY7_41310 [Streptomyces sp. NPDC057062]|uniref:hypothetical protein n=1 Tax=Streptomyces sp. NPDC057062 TaxID=3346011 RepID=UPI00363AD424
MNSAAGVLPVAIVIAALVIKTAIGELRRPGSARRHWQFASDSRALAAGTDMLSFAVPVNPGPAPDDVLNGHHLVVSSRAPGTHHAPDDHTGWIVALYNQNGAPLSGTDPVYCSGDGRRHVQCEADSTAAARAITFFLNKRKPFPFGPLVRPDYVRHCTGPNRRCKKARKQGRSVHILPAPFADGGSLLLPTNHYPNETEARAAVARARHDHEVITTTRST